MTDYPHLLLICPRSEILGKLIGLPVALTLVHRPGGDRALEDAVAMRVIDADFTNPQELLDAARKVHDRRRIDAVLGMTELSLYPASIVADALGARGSAPDTVHLAQNKAAMRDRLAGQGVSVTAHRICETVDDAREFAAAHPAGTILKPVNGNGGTGVMLAREPSEIEAAWAWTCGAQGGWAWHDSGNPPGPVVLAEEFLSGQEYSVETITVDGRHHILAVTGKHTTEEPHFVETGHDVQAEVSPAGRSLISRAAIDALDAIDYRWGASHTEVMLAPGETRATVVEINARHGGDQIWELVELVTGTDMIGGSVASLAHGELPAARAVRAGGAAIRYLTARPGRVAGIDGVDDALALDGVLRIGELCKVGDLLQPLGNSWNRSGYLIAVGADAQTARATAEEAIQRISVRVDESQVAAR
jgi:biotin carboxylase